VSSINIAPGGTITANVKAHDDQKSDTLTFTWSTSAPAGSLTGQSSTATTSQVTLTAPATAGDVTLTIQVQDNHGATASASIVIHVSTANANGTGQADVNVRFNNWPVVSDVIAVPGWITLGKPVSLTVTASDPDGDKLSYLWSTGATCTSGTFTNGTSAARPSRSRLPPPTHTASSTWRSATGVADPAKAPCTSRWERLPLPSLRSSSTPRNRRPWSIPLARSCSPSRPRIRKAAP